MEVLFQSPDIGQTIRLQCSPETLVRDLGVSIAQALRLKSVPILYTYLNERASSELGRSTLVEGDRVVLPDDLRVGWVRDNLRDPSLPIYFENIDVSKSELFELRTLRFRQSGYDVDKLQAKTVLIGGVGLLGGEIAANVATVGVGELRVVDSGFVDWSNIYRQPLFSRDDVYKRKVDAVHDRLVEMGGTTVRTLQLQVPSWRHPLDEAQTRRHVASLDGLLAECSLAIGTFDSFSARAVLQYLCLSRRIPYLIAALEPGFGQVTLYTESKETGCYCC